MTVAVRPSFFGAGTDDLTGCPSALTLLISSDRSEFNFYSQLWPMENTPDTLVNRMIYDPVVLVHKMESM